MAYKLSSRITKVILLVITVITFASAGYAAETDEHILSGSAFVQQKKYKEAVREFKTAVEKDPQNPKANLLLGLTLANTGDLENAVKHLQTSLGASPTYAGYYNLGLVKASQSRFEESVGAFQKALEINAKSYEAWHQLGKVHASSLQFDKAVEAYEHAAELNPKFPDAYQGMGSAYYWSGNLTMALQQVEKLSSLKFDEHAKQLEQWIKNKEAKKKSAKKS